VRGTHVGCANTIPFRIIPDFGKVVEHLLESAIDKSGDIFDDGEFRTQLVDDSSVFEPESAASADFNPRLLSCLADVLAGESSADDIDDFKIVFSDEFDICKPFRTGEVFRQYLPTERL
jgi:hypothetical protein